MLSLKANQGQRHEERTLFFDTGAQASFGEIPVATPETLEADQGRMETRRYWITSALDGIVDHGQWLDAAWAKGLPSARMELIK